MGSYEDDLRTMREILENPNLTHYVGMLSPPRPGVSECLTTLEYTHFQPGTPANDNYQLATLRWEGILWAVVSIPTAQANLMTTIADQCGLRIANGIPMMISGSGLSAFPLESERMFTLENKSGHPAYRNDPNVNHALRTAEDETVARILRSRTDPNAPKN